jgi:hypothetical protein
MAINIKRIIREEIQRIIETNVVYPKFGGGPPPREESELQQVLKKFKDMLEEMLNDEGQSMEDATVVVLNGLFNHVEELYDEASSKDNKASRKDNKASSKDDEGSDEDEEDEGSDEDEEDEESDEDEEDEEPFGGPASDRERDELKGFNDFMKDRDRYGDY